MNREPTNTWPPGVTLPEWAEGPLDIVGRVLPASNRTFLAEIGGTGTRVIYKPTAGERPLWDFAEGTLALREYAAYLVSEATGWDVVPPTTLRDGPAGPGMVQLWQDRTDDQPVDVIPEGSVPQGYRWVLDAVDGAERPVCLVHEDTPALRRMAVFDLMVNNTDRKGGHVLPMPGGHRYGVDHGVCFHEDDKVRTILWGWAGEPLTTEELAGVQRVERELVDGRLGRTLGTLLSSVELVATRHRVHRLLDVPRFPEPDGSWHTIPWPPF